MVRAYEAAGVPVVDVLGPQPARNDVDIKMSIPNDPAAAHAALRRRPPTGPCLFDHSSRYRPIPASPIKTAKAGSAPGRMPGPRRPVT